MSINLRELAGNVRTSPVDDAALRETLRPGWLTHLPAIKDEHGTVLVGNRRLALANELGIEPVIETVRFGDGAAADKARLRLAVASNTGGASLSKEDRKRLVEKMYDGGRGMSQQAIAGVLGVDQATVSRDLGLIMQVHNSGHARSNANPRGAGRPRRGGPQPNRRRTDATAADAAAQRVLTERVPITRAATDAGLPLESVRDAVERETVRRETRTIDRSELSLTAQQKLDTAIRQHKRQLDMQFEQQVRARVVQRIEESQLPHFREEWKEIRRLLEYQRGRISRNEYMKIMRCLHPDSRHNASERALSEAFQAFKRLEVVLVNREERTIDDPNIPGSFAEFSQMMDRMPRQHRRARRGHTQAPARR
jgi:DNA-binding transcriptional MerR regulator